MTNTAAYWDAAADSFDEEADHGLRDPDVRAAWAGRLATWLPEGRLDVLDPGCGTGSLSLLLAERRHRVVGVDLAPRMVELARAKLAGTDAVVLVGDAAHPPVGERRFDVVLWGRAIHDERYAVVARTRHHHGVVRPDAGPMRRPRD